MKNHNKNVLLILTISIAIFSACNTGKYPGFKTTKNGLPYKFYVKSDTGLVPEKGKLLGLKMTYGTKDTVFFNTGETQDGLITLPMSESVYPGDIFEGLALMRLGDSASFMVNADSFYLKTVQAKEVPAFVKGVGDLTFNVKLQKIQTQEEAMLEYQEKLDALQKDEQGMLTNYLATNNITTKPTESGLYFESRTNGTGPLAKDGDLVTVHFAISLLNGVQIFSSKEAGEPVVFELGKPFDTEGMNQALRMMKAGGTAHLIIPSYLAFGEKGRANLIPPFTPLICDVDLIKIQNQAQFNQDKSSEEVSKIKKYISDNNVTAKPTTSGLYYVEQVKGTGPKAKAGDKVKVWYTGKLFDGTVFDASSNRNEAFQFTLGEGRVIKGWDEGIAMMSVGGKATLIIPSGLAYGERGSGQRIPPFSPLIFEVELQDIVK
jgi:FKBP-type peptidyl-prolyl cis-trans isomerase